MEIPQNGLFRLVKRDYIGIFYHVVCDNTLPHTCHLYLHRSISIFEQDLQFLKQTYTILSYPKLKELASKVTKMSKPAIHLSFDDGFIECYTVVRPLLLKYNIPATFFLPTNYIGNEEMYYRNKVSLCIDRVSNASTNEQEKFFQELSQSQAIEISEMQSFIQWIKALTNEQIIDQVCQQSGVDVGEYLRSNAPYLTWDQVNQLVRDGFTVGAHSKKHHKLARLTHNEIQDEIIESCNRVKEMTGVAEVPFSFPNSGDGVDRTLLDHIHRSNPEIGLFFDTKGLKKDRDYIVNRIWAESPKYSPYGVTPLSMIIHGAYRDFLARR